MQNVLLKATPSFAVVGHPNKGKSSMVATLASDSRVAISKMPGTTTVSHSFPMKVDGVLLYELIDTPGFQRSHEVLNWLKSKVVEHGWAANERYKAIKMFLEDHDCQRQFKDECELLKPIIDGAGILYVIDGSRPYGREYEAEMEILRWTGKPSMALINKIGEQDYSQQWHNALGQYFKIVREFNPIDAQWQKRLSLLRAFGEIHQPWQLSLESAIASLESMKKEQEVQCAEVIADCIINIITQQLKVRLKVSGSKEEQKTLLREDFLSDIRKVEVLAHKKILAIYHHSQLEANMERLSGLDLDLFSEEGWSVFGLNHKELMMTGMAGGAAAGGVFDIAVGGASLLAGSGIGALVGGASVWLSKDKLAKVKILGLPFGEQYLRIGPIKNPNFPYVILTRALTLHNIVSHRTHGNRVALDIDTGKSDQIMSQQLKTEIEQEFTKLRKEKMNGLKIKPTLIKLILAILNI